MNADFTPVLNEKNELGAFRFWCQKVLPLTYDDSLSYYELLCKVVKILNDTIENQNKEGEDISNLYNAYVSLQGYTNEYFDNLDVQEEINNKLDKMASSGELYVIIRSYTDPIVDEQNEKINVLKARMDTFASLPEGSTSGDAELTDIRVGYNGTIYPSAGDAVREQVSELNKKIDNYGYKPINLFNKNDLYPTANRYVDPNDGTLKYNASFTSSNYIDVSNIEVIKAVNCFSGAFYTEDKIFCGEVREFNSIKADILINKPINAKYAIISFYTTEIDEVKFGQYVSRNDTQPYFTFENLKVKRMQILDENISVKTTIINVDKSGYADFTTITTALNSITDNDYYNRYEIHVGLGTYEESITTKNYVDIVGEDKYKTIINYTNSSPSEEVSVNQSTIFATSTSKLKNMTITTSGTKYPVHCDDSVGEYDLIIENCIIQHNGTFVNDTMIYGTAIGIGLYGKQNITLRRCVLNAITRDVAYGASAIYCHNSVGSSGSLIMYRQLIVDCCELNEATYGITLQAIEDNELQDNDCYLINVINNGVTKERIEYNAKDSWHVHKFNVV